MRQECRNRERCQSARAPAVTATGLRIRSVASGTRSPNAMPTPPARTGIAGTTSDCRESGAQIPRRGTGGSTSRGVNDQPREDPPRSRGHSDLTASSTPNQLACEFEGRVPPSGEVVNGLRDGVPRKRSAAGMRIDHGEVRFQGNVDVNMRLRERRPNIIAPTAAADTSSFFTDEDGSFVVVGQERELRTSGKTRGVAWAFTKCGSSVNTVFSGQHVGSTSLSLPNMTELNTMPDDVPVAELQPTAWRWPVILLKMLLRTVSVDPFVLSRP